jgi:hypothetical protein
MANWSLFEVNFFPFHDVVEVLGICSSWVCVVGPGPMSSLIPPREAKACPVIGRNSRDVTISYDAAVEFPRRAVT